MDELMAAFIGLLIMGLVVLLIVIAIAAVIVGIVFLIVYAVQSIHFNNSGYSSQSLKYFDLRKDIGAYGEYLTFNELKFFEKSGAKILHNCYLPKSNGETSEIDLLMIHTSGIYVIESKNYSGWIFGNEKQNNWTQTLAKGRRGAQKEKFYNPIMQNSSHIKWLEKQVGHINNIYSLIVFSERCTLKSIDVTSPNVWVIKRNVLKSKISSIAIDNQNVLSQTQVEEMYNKLVVFTGVSQEIKDKHIQNVKRAQGNESFVKNNEYSIEGIKRNDSLKAVRSEKKETTSPLVISSKQVEKVEENTSKTNNDIICPKCGGYLRRKTFKQGTNIGKQYYQCGNNPQCDYERNL